MKKLFLLTTIFVVLFTGCSNKVSNQEIIKDKVKKERKFGDKKQRRGGGGGIDKSYDTKLQNMKKDVISKFETLKFKDSKTNRTMTYNLFKPKNYDANKKYPLVLFMADASTVGKGALSPLTQGYGGIIWATDESQAKNPSFVLVPSFDGPEWVTNDDGTVSEELEIALRVLKNVISTYSIDENRLYTTGQSMGGMISFYLNANYPDLFAASIFVGSQWDVNVLKPLTRKNFFYIVSAGDQKASKGMADFAQMFKDNDVKYGETIFDATLSDKEKENKINELLSQNFDRNFVQFTKGTVIPQGVNGGRGGEHMYSFDYAYQLEAVRDWLFKQKKN